MTQTKDQADGRRCGVLRDQHDREYLAVIEKSTGDPCGPLQPKYDAPLYPEQAYCRVRVNEPSRFDIQYEAWIRDLRAAHQERRREEARFRAQRVSDDVIAEMLGPLPRPVAPVLAAKQGNRYVLGLRLFDPHNPKDRVLQEALATWVSPAAPPDEDFGDEAFRDVEAPEEPTDEAEPDESVLALEAGPATTPRGRRR